MSFFCEKYFKHLSLIKKLMKQFILFVAILFTGFSFGQTNSRAKNSPHEIYEKVDKDATFPGGLNAFRNIFSQRFNANNVKANARVVKTSISFIVERDGTISSVKAVGQNSSFNWEAINTVKKINIKWKPALINKQPVRQR